MAKIEEKFYLFKNETIKNIKDCVEDLEILRTDNKYWISHIVITNKLADLRRFKETLTILKYIDDTNFDKEYEIIVLETMKGIKDNESS